LNFLLTGVSHHDAPLEILERIAVSEQELPSYIQELSDRLDLHDSATILSTCNRTELYAATLNAGATMEEMTSYLCMLGSRRRSSGPNGIEANITPYIYTKTGYEAVHHLFRVVTGLDSLVQGDHQVAGQVSRSFQALSGVNQRADPVLSRMFHVAFRTGRRARKESGIGWSQVSVPSFGVKLLEEEIGDLRGKSALLVGAGETGRITAMSLMRAGIAEMRIASRSRVRSSGLAKDMNAISVPMESISQAMESIDIVITCTGADQHVIFRRDIEAIIRHRSTNLHILDLGLPRDVEPDVGELERVRLYTLSDLARLQTEHQKSIEHASQKAEAIVVEAASEFMDDIELQPLLRDIGESAERIRISELQRTLSKLSPVDDATRQALDAMTRSMVKRILADPIQMVKRRNR
jgi:glutamyl-tRNA reductase